MDFGTISFGRLKPYSKKSQSCVKNNGTFTGYFNLERVARQGDPLSPYLFILALETLFIQVSSDSSIKGFRIKHVEIKLSAYSDDTIFFVNDSVFPKNSKTNEGISSLLIINNQC